MLVLKESQLLAFKVNRLQQNRENFPGMFLLDLMEPWLEASKYEDVEPMFSCLALYPFGEGEDE